MQAVESGLPTLQALFAVPGSYNELDEGSAAAPPAKAGEAAFGPAKADNALAKNEIKGGLKIEGSLGEPGHKDYTYTDTIPADRTAEPPSTIALEEPQAKVHGDYSMGAEIRAEFDDFQNRAEARGDLADDMLELGLSERPEFQIPSATSEIVTPNSPVTEADSTMQALMEHVGQAQERFKNEGFTENQTQAIEGKSALADKDALRAMYYGERIDSFVKESIQGDRRLDHLGVSENFQPGPDFFDPTIDVWYDITTEKSWPDHERTYNRSGTGIHLPSGRLT